jgi:hypothetical protein
MNVVRVKDRQAEIYADENTVEIIQSVLDIFDEPTILNSRKYVKVNELKISLTDEKTISENYKILYHFFKAITEKKYPTQAQKIEINAITKDEILKSLIENYCNKSVCICDIAVSLGCINIDKLLDGLIGCLSNYYPYSLLSKHLDKTKKKIGDRDE